jgi:hypothetical protein
MVVNIHGYIETCVIAQYIAVIGMISTGRWLSIQAEQKDENSRIHENLLTSLWGEIITIIGIGFL